MTETRLRAAAIAVVLACPLLTTLAWARPSQQATANLEVRDEKGVVRCRLGRLDGSAYGLQLLGEDGSHQLSLSVDKDMWVIHGGPGTKDGFIRLIGGMDGTEMTLGQSSEAQARVGLKKSGEFSLVHSTREAGDVLAIRSDAGEGGRSLVQVRHPSRKGPTSGFALIADDKGATLDLLRSERSAVQVASMTEGVAYLLLGARNLGVYMQSAANGNLLLELCNKIPRLTVQSTESGTGIGIDRKDGSTALRLGLTKTEELAKNVFDAEGRKLMWDTK